MYVFLVNLYLYTYSTDIGVASCVIGSDIYTHLITHTLGGGEPLQYSTMIKQYPNTVHCLCSGQWFDNFIGCRCGTAKSKLCFKISKPKYFFYNRRGSSLVFFLCTTAVQHWGDLCGDNMCFGSTCHREVMNIGATCAGTTCVLGVLVTGRSWTLGRVVERWSCTGTN